MTIKRQYDVFLSHSSEDKAFTDKLNDLLVMAGLNSWYDENSLLANSHLNYDIPESIKKCAALMVVLSGNSCSSEWVANEYSTAKEEGLKIIPLVIDDCRLPGFFNNYKWIDCRKGITPYAFFMILSALYGSSENLQDEKDIYVSYPWRSCEQKIVEVIFHRLRRKQYRLIGDAADQENYDDNDRIRRIMNTCGGFVGILPYRGESNTSRYILDEVKKAERYGLPGLLIADVRINGLEQLSGYPIFKYEDVDGIDEEKLKDFINRLDIVRPKTPHVFYATNLDKDRKMINAYIRNLSGYVTATKCVCGEDVNSGNLQQQIIDRIRNAYVMIADITGKAQVISSENEKGDFGVECLYRFNTCVEAGIARGAGTDLYVVCKTPRRSPPFMFRDINVRFYEDDCELLAIVHKILRPYRRCVV